MKIEDYQKLVKSTQFDSLSEAEKITGKSYKESERTSWLGMALAFENSKKVNAELQAANDSHWGTTTAEYIKIVEELGFEKVYEEDIVNPDKWDNKFYVYFCKSTGCLLKFETYWENNSSINSANLNFNWVPKDIDVYDSWKFLQYSGSFRNNVLCASIDARQAFKSNFILMKEMGDFVTPWVEQPFLWLLNYMDSKVEGYDYKEITKTKISKMPDFVKKSILG